jgi:hypothetical protein
MQNSLFFARPEFNGSGLHDETCSGNPSDRPIPTLADITNAHSTSHSHSLRASTSSTSTGASPDDTSTDSPDWPGDSADRSLADLDAHSTNYHLSHRPDSSSSAFLDAPPHFDMDNLPKVEELDDDIQSIKPSDVGTEGRNDSAAPVAVPRKRGRPRKHPLPAPGGQVKVTKGRSKTGCITCRRRKKKCDETKPA